MDPSEEHPIPENRRDLVEQALAAGRDMAKGNVPSSLMQELSAYGLERGCSSTVQTHHIYLQCGLYRLDHGEWAVNDGPITTMVYGHYLTLIISDQRGMADEEFFEAHDPATVGNLDRSDSFSAVEIDSVDEGKAAIDTWLQALKNAEDKPWFYRDTRPQDFASGWPYRMMGPGGQYFHSPPPEAQNRYLEFVKNYIYDEQTNVTAIGVPSVEATLTTKAPPTKSRTARLINSPGVQAMMSLTSNYQNANLFNTLSDYNMVIYNPPGGPSWKAVLDLGDQTRGTWDALEDKEKALWAEMERFANTTRDDALIVAYVLYRLTECQDGILRVGFTELLELERNTTLGAADREKRAREYDTVFRQWHAWKPVGKRQWRDPNTRKLRTIEESSPLFVYQGPFYADGQGPLTGMYKGPLGFTFLDSAMTKEYRNDPALCHFFGTLQDLAQIPPKKPGGDWARSIGLTAGQSIRNNAKNGGATKSLTRRYLLTTHKPHNPVGDILETDNPKRARDYWEEAIGILKERGQIESIVEPPTKWPRQGWGNAWLDEAVTITLGSSWADAPARVLQKTQERKALQDKKTKAQRKPKKPV